MSSEMQPEQKNIVSTKKKIPQFFVGHGYCRMFCAQYPMEEIKEIIRDNLYNNKRIEEDLIVRKGAPGMARKVNFTHFYSNIIPSFSKRVIANWRCCDASVGLTG